MYELLKHQHSFGKSTTQSENEVGKNLELGNQETEYFPEQNLSTGR